MAYIASILAVAAFWLSLFTVVGSIPILDELDARSGFSLPVIHNANRTRNGPLEMYKAFRKFNIEIPDALQHIVHNQQANKAALDQDGSVPAISQDGDLLWITPIGVGTPPQELYVDMDTGSSDSWLFSTDTPKDQVDGQKLYAPDNSSTADLIQGCSWSILYGDFSSSSGICYKDTLSLGGITIKNMTIESATSTSEMFTETASMSGLVGLGWADLAQTEPKQKTLLEFLPEVLPESVFTCDLKHNDTGSYNFGFIDHSLHDSELEYVDVDTSDGFWTILNNGFVIENNAGLKYEFESPKAVIVDTGTTLLFIPDDAASTYFDNVPGANYSYKEYGYLIPCDQTPPDLTLEFVDKANHKITTTIPGEYIIYSHVDDEMCYAGVQSLGPFSAMEGILGDIFLKSSFSVFDIGRKRFGVASKTIETIKKRKTKLEGVDARL